MDNYLVIGHPLSFCLTTPVMNGAFAELGINAKFETKDIQPEDLNDTLEKLKSGELKGIVLTRPHKTPSLEFLDKRTEEVDIIKSVNLMINQDGKIHGYNIDWTGALEAVKTVHPDLKDVHVHILGAGGAARAAAYGMKKECAHVSIWNRTPERAKAFAEKIDIEWVEDMRSWEGSPNIIINATAVSAQPSQSTLVPFPLWENVYLSMDAVYGKTSLFLEEALAAKVQHVISGEVWFLKQVLQLFKIVTGQEPPVELIKQLTQKAQNIRE